MYNVFVTVSYPFLLLKLFILYSPVIELRISMDHEIMRLFKNQRIKIQIDFLITLDNNKSRITLAVVCSIDFGLIKNQFRLFLGQKISLVFKNIRHTVRLKFSIYLIALSRELQGTVDLKPPLSVAFHSMCILANFTVETNIQIPQTSHIKLSIISFSNQTIIMGKKERIKILTFTLGSYFFPYYLIQYLLGVGGVRFFTSQTLKL